jgi:hypothetical protein
MILDDRCWRLDEKQEKVKPRRERRITAKVIEKDEEGKQLWG